MGKRFKKQEFYHASLLGEKKLKNKTFVPCCFTIRGKNKGESFYSVLLCTQDKIYKKQKFCTT